MCDTCHGADGAFDGVNDLDFGAKSNWLTGVYDGVLLAPGKSAFDYQFTDMSQQLSLGTFCHENGHMLCDYPDLYDYGNESSGVGAYCLMCTGGNIDEKNPANISAYLKRLSGWANSVTSIQPNNQISLPAGENNFAMFAKDSGEYFILENRAKIGRDSSLPDEGLAIWHAEEDGNNSNEQMTPSKHYELSLEQADGDFSLEKSLQYGDSTDLFGQANKHFSDTTVPSSKWWDGTMSKLDIREISAPGAVISFQAFDNGGQQTVEGESTPNLDIPDNRADGIADTIVLNEDAIITAVQVGLDISHTYRGDLRVTLMTPWSESIVLHQRNQGGSGDNIKQEIDESDIQALATLHGHSTKGDWKLLIQDLASADTGTLNQWALKFSVTPQEQGPVILEESPGAHIPDDNVAGIQRTLSTYAPGNVGRVEVSVDITHTWIADLKLSLRSTTGTEVILHDGDGGSADDILKTYTMDTTPELGNLAGQSISGDWLLRVSDHANRDTGKLNSWRVVIHPDL